MVSSFNKRDSTRHFHKKKTSLENQLNLWVKFTILTIVLAISGFYIEKYGIKIAYKLGISQTILGTFFTSMATSLPELVVTLSAVRANALTLAVGGIIGGNTFDVLFLAFSDIALRKESIYHSMNNDHFTLITINIAMTAVLLLGLLGREKFGPKNIGIETWGMIIIFIFGMLSIIH